MSNKNLKHMLTVTIMPHHLRGNSWSHGYEGRMCPLHEALVEAGHQSVVVHAESFTANGIRYRLPLQLGNAEPTVDGWTTARASHLIQKANEGCEQSHTFEFKAQTEEVLN